MVALYVISGSPLSRELLRLLYLPLGNAGQSNSIFNLFNPLHNGISPESGPSDRFSWSPGQQIAPNHINVLNGVSGGLQDLRLMLSLRGLRSLVDLLDVSTTRRRLSCHLLAGTLDRNDAAVAAVVEAATAAAAASSAVSEASQALQLKAPDTTDVTSSADLAALQHQAMIATADLAAATDALQGTRITRESDLDALLQLISSLLVGLRDPTCPLPSRTGGPGTETVAEFDDVEEFVEAQCLVSGAIHLLGEDPRSRDPDTAYLLLVKLNKCLVQGGPALIRFNFPALLFEVSLSLFHFHVYN
ncbi:unnamed protein product [Protopolystoma xenopodis]|uniref:Uncharacterized protein n=1 Tax=Protopolystoma xenopodis TaxID=117903 RepID=A0A3S5FGD1_9PLAT|nr:unnamed protein product [Protopolystoma xenopodis]